MEGFPVEAFLTIGFTLHSQILTSAKGYDERVFYIRRCADERYRVEDLKRSMRNDDYHHQSRMPNNFLSAMPSAQRALRAIETFKDEYLLDFVNVEELGVRDAGDVDERVVEQAIVNNVKNFIMEFGRGFSFISNAYHLDAFGEDQFVDLLFFNRDLNCLVAVELKRGKFKTAYLGQLSGYLSVLDEWCGKMDYRHFAFHAVDDQGTPVYHTNVMMSLGTSHAVVCMEAVTDPRRRMHLDMLLTVSGREVVTITKQQMKRFAGNMLELRNNQDEKLLVMSQTARQSLSDDQLARLQKHVRILSPDIHHIEQAGGGSVRCMLAELF